ncbi:MAG: hypothetical protein ISS74_10540 [Planctomycetes bacterium]|nr:hypothetical protein [Planctomycetota bacterium]
MTDYVNRAKKVVKDVMKEFEPVGDHAVTAGREMLLAMRSVVDAEINLLDRATSKKKAAEPEPLAEPSKTPPKTPPKTP